ncbi:hypothetical protein NC651_004514 [Populus alba x Populus x berolinensis]|nr:hypothetical protein NC651_004514 [Populus alba x Populus x berolinensis]
MKIFSQLFLRKVDSSKEGKTTIHVAFTTLFLNDVDKLLSLMHENFPELGLVKEDCIEISWIKSTHYFAGFPSNSSLDVLVDKTPIYMKTNMSFFSIVFILNINYKRE